MDAITTMIFDLHPHKYYTAVVNGNTVRLCRAVLFFMPVPDRRLDLPPRFKIHITPFKGLALNHGFNRRLDFLETPSGSLNATTTLMDVPGSIPSEVDLGHSARTAIKDLCAYWFKILGTSVNRLYFKIEVPAEAVEPKPRERVIELERDRFRDYYRNSGVLLCSDGVRALANTLKLTLGPKLILKLTPDPTHPLCHLEHTVQVNVMNAVVAADCLVTTKDRNTRVWRLLPVASSALKRLCDQWATTKLYMHVSVPTVQQARLVFEGSRGDGWYCSVPGCIMRICSESWNWLRKIFVTEGHASKFEAMLTPVSDEALNEARKSNSFVIRWTDDGFQLLSPGATTFVTFLPSAHAYLRKQLDEWGTNHIAVNLKSLVDEQA